MNTIELRPITDDNSNILDLMFLSINDNKFKYSSTDSKGKQTKYKETMLSTKGMTLGVIIYYNNAPTGFIIVRGNDNRLIGGLLPNYTGKGVYKLARNTVIGLLNDKDIFLITSSVDSSNKNMLAFLKQVPKTLLHDDVFVNHLDVTLKRVKVDSKVSVNNRVLLTKFKFYHVSVYNELKQSNNNTISIFPSKALALRAISPNLSFSKHLTVYVYEIIFNKKSTLVPHDDLIKTIHDAHITLEYQATNITFNLTGSMALLYTSKGSKLMYKPFTTGKITYHSPMTYHYL